MKTKQTKPVSHPPVNLVVPSVTTEKMHAILSLSSAIYELSKALNSVNVLVDISHCTFTGSKHPAINVATE